MKLPLPVRAQLVGIVLGVFPLSWTAPALAAEPRGTAPTATAVADRVAKIQSALQAAGIDGWLFYDFRGINPIANRLLLMPGTGIASRRWLYFIPATGTPVRIVHAIEPHRLDHLPGAKTVYSAWPTLQDAIRTTLVSQKRVAMEYSPDGGIPYLARVDAGTIDFVRSTGATVVSSGGLLEQFEAVWTPAQRAQHERAATVLRQVINEAWAQIARATRAGEFIDERLVQEQCAKRAEELGLGHDRPIVAVNANAADPHYFPLGPRSTPIRRGDLVLIDITGKLREPNAVNADITWMGVVDETVPARFEKIWTIVAAARDAAVEFIRTRAAAGQLPAGFEVDDVARGVITQAGYGDKFIHRTGHSIDLEVHGNGTHLDNFETHDERRLVPHTCFSIEPGIYLAGDFGVRSEIDVYLDGTTPVITGGPAQEASFQFSRSRRSNRRRTRSTIKAPRALRPPAGVALLLSPIYLCSPSSPSRSCPPSNSPLTSGRASSRKPMPPSPSRPRPSRPRAIRAARAGCTISPRRAITGGPIQKIPRGPTSSATG